MRNILIGRYMATCVPGGESILEEEIRELPIALQVEIVERGKVFFRTEAGEDALFALRCADNIYRVLARFPIGPHKDALVPLEMTVARLDCRELREARGRRIIVSASRAGKHTYSRYDLADRVAAGLVKQGFVPGDEKAHDVAFRLDVRDDAALFSAQLTDAQFRFRGASFQSSKGGIRPTVAHMLVRLSEPEAGDVFCDPFCGGGTIPFERGCYPAAEIWAGDIDDGALAAARENLPAHVHLIRADATDMPLAADSVDAVVTNMPWGKQIVVDDLPRLYRAFAMELRRVLKRDGRAILFTDQEDILLDAFRGAGFRVGVAARFSLHGLHPAAFAAVLDD